MCLKHLFEKREICPRCGRRRKLVPFTFGWPLLITVRLCQDCANHHSQLWRIAGGIGKEG